MANSVFITPFGGTIQGDVIITGQGLLADGSATAPSLAFASDTTQGMYRPSASVFGLTDGGGGAGLFIGTSGQVLVGKPGSYFNFGVTTAAAASEISMNASSPFGWSASDGGAALDTIMARASVGVFQFKTTTATVTMAVPTGTTNVSPVVVSDPATRKVGATSAQTIGSFTVGAADATFRVSANILVTTATTHSFTVTCAYTDEGNTARTLTLNFSTLAGVISNTAIGNAGGAVPYNGVVQHIRCKAATTITIATTGTFTTVTYNGEGIIEKVT